MPENIKYSTIEQKKIGTKTAQLFLRLGIVLEAFSYFRNQNIYSDIV